MKIEKIRQHTHFLSRLNGRKMAYQCDGNMHKNAGIVFLSGFMGDMKGNKVNALRELSRKMDTPFMCFDHIGHGESGGEFSNATVKGMLDDICALFKKNITQPQTIVGSSMGGWLAYLVAQFYPQYVKNLLILAPAFNFTEMFYNALSQKLRDELNHTGMCDILLSDDGTEITIKKPLFEEGAQYNLKEGQKVAIHCPVHIIHGTKDDVVPWVKSQTFFECLQGSSVMLTLIKDATHRLSSSADLDVLVEHAYGLVKKSVARD